MSDKPYCEFAKEELILRDHLAIDRTILANERTLLSYVRTGLAFLIAGGSLIKFFDTIFTIVAGWSLMPIGIFALVIGILRYKKMAKQINSARNYDL